MVEVYFQSSISFMQFQEFYRNFAAQCLDTKLLKKYMYFLSSHECTVLILSFRTDRPGRTVQTQIKLLLLEEQSDQGLYYFAIPFAPF